MYAYGAPIKYTDDDGYVQFIDSRLMPALRPDGLFEWYAYANTANSIRTFFPNRINTGLLIENEGYSLKMSPKRIIMHGLSKRAKTPSNIITYTVAGLRCNMYLKTPALKRI